MKQLTPEQQEAVKRIRSHQRPFVEWLNSYHEYELSRLPNALTNTAVAQGRCQVLAEVCNLFKEPPEKPAAQLD